MIEPPCHYEKEESLEQLRLIWNNVPIYCVQAKNNKSIGINSASDLKKQENCMVTKNITITGAAGNIAYSLIFRVLSNPTI